MKHPVFLTDKSRSVLLEVLEGVPDAALPDSCRPFEILDPRVCGESSEKHLPQIQADGCHVTVSIGVSPHPMSETHQISRICLETRAGAIMQVPLSPSCLPEAHFTLEPGDVPKAAYGMCSLHGIWKTEWNG